MISLKSHSVLDTKLETTKKGERKGIDIFWKCWTDSVDELQLIMEQCWELYFKEIEPVCVAISLWKYWVWLLLLVIMLMYSYT